MKRTNLTTAVIAAIAGVAGISNMANAVYLNADGTGQVLIYPYYTVNKGNATALTVVNTTSQGKAVKVRHIEGYNSREVLDYNLYMSPYDVWVAEIVAVGSGAGVFTTDNSCTVPALPTSAATAQPFSTLAFTGASSDGGPTSVSRTLEGYTELIEMGVVTNANDGTLTAITHANGVPANCAQLVKAWSTGGYWLSGNVNNDITAASGGLFGSGTIVNVALGTVEGYNADAIDNFWTGTPAFEHDQPGSLAPNLNEAGPSTAYVFAKTTTGTTASVTSSSFSRSVDAVSALFMAADIYNEYWTDTSLGLASEWVITMPTKRFYVDPATVTGAPLKPFDVAFSSANGGTSCSGVVPSWWDREELSPTAAPTGPCFSPCVTPKPTNDYLCYEANVVTFNQSQLVPTTVLGSVLSLRAGNSATALSPATLGVYANGWAQLDLASAAPTQHILTDEGGDIYGGLPVTGFWVTQFANSAVKVSSNYTALYGHKYNRVITPGS